MGEGIIVRRGQSTFDATAVESDVKTGKTFYAGGQKKTGNMTYYMPNFFGNGADGALNTSGNVTFSVTAHTGAVIKQYTSITINSGHTLTVDNPCRGLVLYSQGNVTINGTISMSKKAGFGTGELPLIPIYGIDAYYKLVSDLTNLKGGSGGNGGNAGYYDTGGNGGCGGTGGTGRICAGGFGGGGGGGGSSDFFGGNGGSVPFPYAGGIPPSVYPTSEINVHTGSDYISLNSRINAICGNGGGIRFYGVNPKGYLSGGACLGGGGGGSYFWSTSVGAPETKTPHTNGEYAGGFVLIIAGGSITIGSGGKIEANGGNGGNGGGLTLPSGSSFTNVGGGGGGGAGGGVIALYYTETYTNNGTLQVNGGSGGNGGSCPGRPGSAGTSGSAGTISINKIN